MSSSRIRTLSTSVLGLLAVLAASCLMAHPASAQTTQTRSTAYIYRVPHFDHGCPAYAVCFYPAGKGWNGDRPSFYYNFHSDKPTHYWSNFHDVRGTLRVYDNGFDQTTCYGYDREPMTLNTGYNGGGTHTWLYPGHFIDANLTPINSITLWHQFWWSGTCA